MQIILFVCGTDLAVSALPKAAWVGRCAGEEFQFRVHRVHKKNAFLSRLAAPEFALFRSHLAPLELQVVDSLHRCGERIENIIFPNSGLVTIRPLTRGRRRGRSIGRTRNCHWRVCRDWRRAGKL